MTPIPPPYYLCSAKQSRAMDERTIQDFGIDGFTLMEIAGTRAADFIQSQMADGCHGLFLCGKGNNAGDALVVARLLSQQGYSATFCFLSGTDDLSADTQKNLELFQKLGIEAAFRKPDELSDIQVDFIVDGMLGTGLDSDVRAPYDEVIKWVNEQEIPVFSMDVPTGLHTDSGEIMGQAIKADFTLSFGSLKTGFYLNEGYEHAGEVILCELSFPNQYKEPTAYLLDSGWVERLSPKKKDTKHKYDGGVLYLIAGSEGLTGAAALAAKSAWGAGLGAVVLITPKGLLEIYEKNLIQIIKKPVGDSTDVHFKASHSDTVLEILHEKEGTLLIGPGMGRDKDTQAFIGEILQSYKGNAVIDADALFALSEHPEWKKPDASRWVLTPHPGELRSILKDEVTDDWDRLIAVKEYAHQQELTLLSKGRPSIIGTNSGDAYLTGYDTRIFSRAGYGDVLAGKVGAFWLFYEDAAFACFHALLDGYQKAMQYSAQNGSSLEPMDII